jgi:glycerophosphoryl diester phosphodiesterase
MLRPFPILLSAAALLLGAYTANAQLIIAHRGASADAPENTLAAFELAWERGADGIEGDFYLTADGEIVCIHDATTKRTTGEAADLQVAATSSAELRKLDVGSWKHPKFSAERIPTLREVLQIIPAGKKIFIEIKCGPEIVPILKAQLAESPHVKAEQIAIICFNQKVIAACRQQLPHLAANWLVSYKQDEHSGEMKPSRDSVLATLEKTGARGLGTQANAEVIDRKFVAAIRELGCAFHCWTINDAALAKAFKELGVDSITTDRPAFIRAACQPAAPPR